MPQATGAQARFAFCDETVWGTTPGTPSMKLLKAAVYGESLGAEVEELISNSINSNRAVEAVRQGNISVKGAVPIEIAPLGLASVLKHAFGGKTTAGGGPYVHTLKRGALPAGMTIEKGFPDLGQYIQFKGCKVNALSLTIGARGLITGSLDVIARSFAVAGTALGTPTAVAHVPFAQHEVVTQEGGGAATFLSLSMNITNEIDTDYEIGSQNIGSANEGKGNTTGEVTLRFDSMTTFNKWLNATSSSLKATMTTGANSLELFFPNITYIGDAIPKIAGSKGVIVPLKFRAIYDGSEQTDVKATFTNTEATI